MYSYIWMVPWRLKFLCGRFGTLCCIFIGHTRTKRNKKSRNALSSKFKFTKALYMFRPMKVQLQDVSFRIQALWCNVMSKCVLHYGGSSMYIVYRVQEIHRNYSKNYYRTYTRSVNKVMRLIQYNSVLTFKLQIEFVAFRIVPLGGYTPPETLFPLFVAKLVVANRNRF